MICWLLAASTPVPAASTAFGWSVRAADCLIEKSFHGRAVVWLGGVKSQAGGEWADVLFQIWQRADARHIRWSCCNLDQDRLQRC